MHRVAVEEATQVGAEFGCIPVAPFWGLVEGSQRDRLQVLIDPQPDQGASVDRLVAYPARQGSLTRI